ncbi:conjugal transfer pilus assembly protein TraB [Novimethylophilus kurashikiensis]|uniref:Conjugal transfer pilus assembly protein TraB n=1 Tax=Novimethylophilus kurashikiensis TaxID=1825523 RepID=A0A2R5F840_9PROT|nr:TraB/VirB10 family protein [Novimethylophilus kurashikiensis]GBG14410.1 conjugal transfer pilus assembly protein TraB [Novimethylophilus kurashikiensis]
MADQNYSSADKQISISGGKAPKAINAKAMLDGMTKDVRKRWMIVLGVGAISISVLGGWMSSSNQPVKPKKLADDSVSIDTTPKGLSAQKDWKAQTGAEMQALKQSLADSTAAQKELLARMEALRQEVQQVKAAPSTQQSSAPSKVEFNLPPPPEPPKSIQPAQAAQPSQAAGATFSNGPFDAPRVTTPAVMPARSFIPGPTVEEQAAAAAEKDKVQEDMVPNDRMGFLPAGSFSSATMISGVEAFTGGTAQSQPQPVVVRIDENAVLPNAAKYQIKGCHVLASVWGDMSSERVYGRLATLTCVDANNKLVLSEEVEGNLIDSDGKNGIRGTLQDRQGAKLARSLLAGFAQGMASAFGTAQGVVTNSVFGATQTISGGDAMASAGYKGANTAANTLAQFYLKQAEATMPVIAVDAGRKISVLFTKSKALKFETTGNYKNKPSKTIRVEREVN